MTNRIIAATIMATALISSAAAQQITRPNATAHSRQPYLTTGQANALRTVSDAKTIGSSVVVFEPQQLPIVRVTATGSK